MKAKVILLSDGTISGLQVKLQTATDEAIKEGLSPPSRFEIGHHDGEREKFFYALGVAISSSAAPQLAAEEPRWSLTGPAQRPARPRAKRPKRLRSTRTTGTRPGAGKKVAKK